MSDASRHLRSALCRHVPEPGEPSAILARIALNEQADALAMRREHHILSAGGGVEGHAPDQSHGVPSGTRGLAQGLSVSRQLSAPDQHKPVSSPARQHSSYTTCFSYDGSEPLPLSARIGGAALLALIVLLLWSVFA